jgi:tetratricopeptide (TPR) repeat protein
VRDARLLGHMEGEEGAATQLAEQFPQIDSPLRVEPPVEMKAPRRLVTTTRDQQIRSTAFSPQAYKQRELTLATIAADPGSAPTLLSADSPIRARKGPVAQQDQASFRTAVANYTTLAFSSQRAGKLQMEAQAYFAIGVTYDNMGSYKDALDAYRKFLATCKKSGDAVSEALAYNCMGVDCMHIARPPAEGAQFEADELSEEAVASLTRAIAHHEAHLAIADDGGKFMARTNVGLCYGMLGDHLAAARHHQEALRIAIQLQSFSGQSISVGNLGALAIRQGDFATAKPCMEQHLQLVQSLKDFSAEINAWLQLGHLEKHEGNFEEAIHCYEQANQIAEQQGEIGTLKRVNCHIGMARGSLALNKHMEKLAASVQ